MAIFNSYVSLPEGSWFEVCKLGESSRFQGESSWSVHGRMTITHSSRTRQVIHRNVHHSFPYSSRIPARILDLFISPPFLHAKSRILPKNLGLKSGIPLEIWDDSDAFHKIQQHPATLEEDEVLEDDLSTWSHHPGQDGAPGMMGFPSLFFFFGLSSPGNPWIRMITLGYDHDLRTSRKEWQVSLILPIKTGIRAQKCGSAVSDPTFSATGVSTCVIVESSWNRKNMGSSKICPF